MELDLNKSSLLIISKLSQELNLQPNRVVEKALLNLYDEWNKYKIKSRDYWRELEDKKNHNE